MGGIRERRENNDSIDTSITPDNMSEGSWQELLELSILSARFTKALDIRSSLKAFDEIA